MSTKDQPSRHQILLPKDSLNALTGGPGEPKINVIEENADFRFVNSFPLINLTTHSDEWWLDSGAQIHVSFDRSWFTTNQKSCGESVTLGDATTIDMIEKGHVDLKKTFGKTYSA